MKVNQIHTILNSVTSEILGKTDVVNEDLSNVVDVGVEVFNATNIDNFVKKLVDKVGKVIFTDRKYSGSVPNALMDSWEFGSVLQKISAELPEVKKNDTWDLQDGQSYSDDVFYQPKVSAKFFNNRVTFEIPVSITDRQVKSAFNSKEELNGFLSMIYTSVENAITIEIEALIMRTLNSMTGEVLHANDGVRNIDLLATYNKATSNSLTATNCLMDKDFIRFAVYTMNLYVDRLSKVSTLFNGGHTQKFTNKEDLNIVLLNDFASAYSTFMVSDTFNTENVILPNYMTVPYWQGSGLNYSLASTSKIDIKTPSGATVSKSGIIGVMYDTYALGVCNEDRRVTTSYNARAEFYNNYYKFDCAYFCDLNENFIVFTIGDITPAKAKSK